MNFVLSVCPSARPLTRMEQLVPNWRDFYEILYWEFYLLKFVEPFRFLLKLDQNNRHFIWRPTYVLIPGCYWFHNLYGLFRVRYDLRSKKQLNIEHRASSMLDCAGWDTDNVERCILYISPLAISWWWSVAVCHNTQYFNGKCCEFNV